MAFLKEQPAGRLRVRALIAIATIAIVTIVITAAILSAPPALADHPKTPPPDKATLKTPASFTLYRYPASA